MRTKPDKPLLVEDYLIRIINMALAAIGRVMGFRTAGQIQAAHQVIQQVLEEIFGLRAYMIRMLEDQVLLDFMTYQGRLNTDLALVVADLMRMEGDLFREQGNSPEAYWSHLRAMQFYLAVEENGGPLNFPAPHESIAVLVPTLAGFDLPVGTLSSLLAYCLIQGAYQTGLEIAERALQASPASEEVQGVCLDYFQQLAERSDEALLGGGLSRDQVDGWLVRLEPVEGHQMGNLRPESGSRLAAD